MHPTTLLSWTEAEGESVFLWLAASGHSTRLQMGAELQDHLRSIDTPAYDPDAHRIAWRWRWSRREVTPNHHRETFAVILASVEIPPASLSPPRRAVG